MGQPACKLGTFFKPLTLPETFLNNFQKNGLLPVLHKKSKFECFSRKSIFLEIVQNWLSYCQGTIKNANNLQAGLPAPAFAPPIPHL